MTPPVDARIDEARRCAVIATTFHHPVEVVWTLFTDPDRLARWWGPPGMPMVISRHELRPGGTIDLVVTTPGGDIRARWDVHAVDAPRDLRFTFSSDGIGPTDVEVALAGDGPTTLTVTTRFRDEAGLAHARAIGFVEGVTRSVAGAHDVVGT